MKLNVTANLKFGPGKVFMKGVYEGEIPNELIAEMKSGSRHISEVDVPNIRKPSAEAIAKKKAAAEKRKKVVAAKKAAAKKAAEEKAVAERKATEKEK